MEKEYLKQFKRYFKYYDLKLILDRFLIVKHQPLDYKRYRMSTVEISKNDKYFKGDLIPWRTTFDGILCAWLHMYYIAVNPEYFEFDYQYIRIKSQFILYRAIEDGYLIEDTQYRKKIKGNIKRIKNNVSFYFE